MFYTKKQREELRDNLRRLTEKNAELESRIVEGKKETNTKLDEHTEYFKVASENIDRVRSAVNSLVEETESNLTEKINNVEGNLELKINSQTQALEENFNDIIGDLHKGVDAFSNKVKSDIDNLSTDLSRSNEQLQDKISAEVASLEDRLIAKITDMLGNTSLDLQNLMAKKIKQLEIFKEGEELLGDNAIGFAVIQEMVKRAFRKEYEAIETQNREIEDQKRKMKVEELKLKQLKFVGSVTVDEFTKELEGLNEIYLENSRRSTSTNDTFDIKAQCAKYTIDFLTKWKNEKS